MARDIMYAVAKGEDPQGEKRAQRQVGTFAELAQSDAMNRIQNHREGGIASVYDRHGYAEETKRIMEAVAAELIRLAEGRAARGNVVPLRGS
jgi:hypothetical protein